MDDKTRTELEAAAFRALVHHLMVKRPDVQNIDLMNLGGFCRNDAHGSSLPPTHGKLSLRARGGDSRADDIDHGGEVNARALTYVTGLNRPC